MTPADFKQWKKEEFQDALSLRCKEESIQLQIVDDARMMMWGLDHNNNTAYLLGHEVYRIYNNGDRIQWDFITNRM